MIVIALRNERGFTAVELLLASATIALVLSAVYVALSAGLVTAELGGGKVEAQQAVRTVLDRMARDAREAGYDPRAVGFDPVTTMSATEVTLQLDRNGNGVINGPATACDEATAERIRYRVTGQQIERSPDPFDATCTQILVLGTQTTFTLSYLDLTGATTATAANVRTIVVSIALAPASATTSQVGPMMSVMRHAIRLRNR
jgi:type II secretory pathway component PulJ